MYAYKQKIAECCQTSQIRNNKLVWYDLKVREVLDVLGLKV